MQLTQEQIQAIKDAKNLCEIALSKLEAYLLPEKESLSPKAQEQLTEIHHCLSQSKSKLQAPPPMSPEQARKILTTVYRDILLRQEPGFPVSRTDFKKFEKQGKAEANALSDQEALSKVLQTNNWREMLLALQCFPEGTIGGRGKTIEINNLKKDDKPQKGEILFEGKGRDRNWFLVVHKGLLAQIRVCEAAKDSGYDAFAVLDITEDDPEDRKHRLRAVKSLSK